jgi:hypothetical protein
MCYLASANQYLERKMSLAIGKGFSKYIPGIIKPIYANSSSGGGLGSIIRRIIKARSAASEAQTEDASASEANASEAQTEDTTLANQRKSIFGTASGLFSRGSIFGVK